MISETLTILQGDVRQTLRQLPEKSVHCAITSPPTSETLFWRATCKCGTDERTGATVLDPFGGSGTTAEAAIMAGRKAVLCELNPDYVKLIHERLDAACPLLAGTK